MFGREPQYLWSGGLANWLGLNGNNDKNNSIIAEQQARLAQESAALDAQYGKSYLNYQPTANSQLQVTDDTFKNLQGFADTRKTMNLQQGVNEANYQRNYLGNPQQRAQAAGNTSLASPTMPAKPAAQPMAQPVSQPQIQRTGNSFGLPMSKPAAPTGQDRVINSFDSNGNVQRFAQGGVVGMHPGEPRGTDTVPAWLTPGEAVLTKEATALLGPERIEALNTAARALMGGQMGGMPMEDEGAEYRANGGVIYAELGFDGEDYGALKPNPEWVAFQQAQARDRIIQNAADVIPESTGFTRASRGWDARNFHPEPRVYPQGETNMFADSGFNTMSRSATDIGQRSPSSISSRLNNLRSAVLNNQQNQALLRDNVIQNAIDNVPKSTGFTEASQAWATKNGTRFLTDAGMMGRGTTGPKVAPSSRSLSNMNMGSTGAPVINEPPPSEPVPAKGPGMLKQFGKGVAQGLAFEALNRALEQPWANGSGSDNNYTGAALMRTAQAIPAFAFDTLFGTNATEPNDYEATRGQIGQAVKDLSHVKGFENIATEDSPLNRWLNYQGHPMSQDKFNEFLDRKYDGRLGDLRQGFHLNDDLARKLGMDVPRGAQQGGAQSGSAEPLQNANNSFNDERDQVPGFSKSYPAQNFAPSYDDVKGANDQQALVTDSKAKLPEGYKFNRGADRDTISGDGFRISYTPNKAGDPNREVRFDEQGRPYEGQMSQDQADAYNRGAASGMEAVNKGFMEGRYAMHKTGSPEYEAERKRAIQASEDFDRNVGWYPGGSLDHGQFKDKIHADAVAAQREATMAQQEGNNIYRQALLKDRQDARDWQETKYLTAQQQKELSDFQGTASDAFQSEYNMGFGNNKKMRNDKAGAAATSLLMPQLMATHQKYYKDVPFGRFTLGAKPGYVDANTPYLKLADGTFMIAGIDPWQPQSKDESDWVARTPPNQVAAKLKELWGNRNQSIFRGA